MAQAVQRTLLRNLEELLALSNTERLRLRYAKFRAHGHFQENLPMAAAVA